MINLKKSYTKHIRTITAKSIKKIVKLRVTLLTTLIIMAFSFLTAGKVHLVLLTHLIHLRTASNMELAGIQITYIVRGTAATRDMSVM